MEKGLLGRNAVRWVTLEHLIKEVETLLIEWHQVTKILCGVHLLVLRLKRQFFVARPVILIRRAPNLEYFLQLLTFVLSRKQGLTVDNLGENAANRPNINRGTVVLTAHQNVGGAIPKSDHLMSEVFHRDSKSTS